MFAVKVSTFTCSSQAESGWPDYLQYRFLSTSTGFSYLRRADYIDREIDEWYNASRRIVQLIWCSQSDRGAAILQYRNVQYVSQIEMYLAEGLRPEMTVQGMFSHT